MRTKFFTITIILVLLFSQIAVAAIAPPPTPNPIIFFAGAEYFTSGGKNFVRYRFDVFNREDFSNDMFAAAPALPPCGANNNSSRTWVDVFDQQGHRLNSFCAIGRPSDLHGMWFAIEADKVPPSWIYLEFNDRQTNTKYKSNLAETVM